MIKNLNDLLSFVVLSLLSLYSISFLLLAFIKKKRKEFNEDDHINRWELFKNYIENVEE